MVKKKTHKKSSKKTTEKVPKKIIGKIKKKLKFQTVDLRTERDIAMDFAVKTYKRFDNIVKAVILFGSSVRETSTSTSDIDLIIVIDDASIAWDQELIAWYREELGKLVSANPYKKELHITTVKITTWWNDLLKGDPVVVNVLRYGEALVDVGGFFNPLKALLLQGRIKSTAEAIYVALNRAPEHLRRSQNAELGAIEGVFWAMVDSAQAALMSMNVMPPSPEHIPLLLNDTFVSCKKLDDKYIAWFRDVYVLHRKIVHGEVNVIKGGEIQEWQEKTEEFISVMVKLIKQSIEANKE